MRRCAVIMAGGSGTRLWPLSRKARPKQLLKLVEGRSLMELAFERLCSIFAPPDIYVIALAEHLPAIAAALPRLPPENLIGEPMGRDTANAIALSASILHQGDPETVMGVFTADHLIRPDDIFAESVRRGFAAAESHPQALVTFGIKPDRPHTGYGYIQRGETVSPGVYRVQRFHEKPDAATARAFVESGDCFWNSGMFVWRTATILDALRLHLPQSFDAASRIAAAWGTTAGQKLAQDLYPSLPKISIDYAVMEKAADVALVVKMSVQWADLGDWLGLAGLTGRDDRGNALAAPRVAVIDSADSIFVAEDEHLIAAVGVEDLLVVHSPDATFICRRNQVQRIKELVERLEVEFDGRYL